MKELLTLLLTLTLLAISYTSADTHNLGDELLEPEQAFAVFARLVDTRTLQVNFAIANGYYLYHDKFRFTPLTNGITLDDAVIPPGKIKHDEFFGDIETHRKMLSIRVPYSGDAINTNSLTFQSISQGCADIGVCYPPLKQNLTVSLPVSTQQPIHPLSQLLSLVDNNKANNDANPLEPDHAFTMTILPVKGNEITLEWAIAEEYYLYHDKFQFSLEDGGGIGLGDAIVSPGKIKDDPYFGKTWIHRNRVRARLPLRNLNAATEAILNVTYQGCADLGICYPPIKKQIQVNLTPDATVKLSNSKVGKQHLTEQGRIAASLASGNTWLMIFTFLGLGLLLTFTPCVFPMLPILSSIIVGQEKKINTGRAFSLSLIYVLAVAATYTGAGIAVGLSGENIQVWFQTPWVLGVFVLILVLLALSMFGFYDLQVPVSLQSRLIRWSNSRQGGTLLGAMIMGFLSALIVGPCMTAPLIGTLIYIADTGDAVLGGVALFALSIGMGIPLLMIGTSAGILLPKAGAWMNTIKTVFGVLLLALAIWILERILHLSATMALSALLFIACAIYMGALEPLREPTRGWPTLWKSLGIALFIYAVILALGAASGGTSFIYPLKGLIDSNTAINSVHTPFLQIKGIDGLNTALEQSRTENRTTMLDFYADWCISCKEMDAFTFSDPVVKKYLSNTVLLQADVTLNDKLDQALLKQMGIFGPPSILFFDKYGHEIVNSRVVGFMPPEEFAKHVRRVLML